MSKFKNVNPLDTVVGKSALLVFAIVINVLFYTWEAGGQTGAEAIYSESVILGVILTLVGLFPIAGMIYFLIKKVWLQ